MKQGRIALFVGAWCLAGSTTVFGQSESTTEVGSDGTKYMVTKNTWQESVPYTEIETRTERVYQPQQSTQVQSYQQTYAVPVTEYRMVSRLRGWWNPLTAPYWTHEMQPVTRWEYRSAKVEMPVSRTEWVEGTRTVQVPVTKYRTENKTLVSRVPVSDSSSNQGIDSLGPQTTSSPIVASRPADSRYGSQRITSDPPRSPTHLR